MKSKEEECHGIKAIVKELKIGRRRRCHKRLEFGYSSRVGQVRESDRRIPTAKTKLRKQAARETQEKEKKAKLHVKKTFQAKTIEKASNAAKLNVKLHKLVKMKVHGTHLQVDWQRFWGQFEATIDKSDIGQVAKLS